MKVLYLGNWRDGTGWGNAAQGYILSLDAAGIDVVPRHIKLNDREIEVPERILELERRSHKNCDVVIQHVLPHYLDYNGSEKILETREANSYCIIHNSHMLKF